MLFWHLQGVASHRGLATSYWALSKEDFKGAWKWRTGDEKEEENGKKKNVEKMGKGEEGEKPHLGQGAHEELPIVLMDHVALGSHRD